MRKFRFPKILGVKIFYFISNKFQDLEELFKIYLPDLVKILIGKEDYLESREAVFSLVQTYSGPTCDVISLGEYDIR
jgi:hypothetical protein